MTTAVDVDSVVVGAGVVGLAVAREIALAGRDVFLLEANERPGEGISSRNSGVIHAGMYYPTESLKARCCVRGLQLMYAYAVRRGVGHRRTGKLIVATDSEDLVALEALQHRAGANGVRVNWLDGAAARALEPALHCLAALDSPDSGIVDVPELMTALLGEIEQLGGQLVCRTKVVDVHVDDAGFRVETDGGDSIRCRHVVNAAGLGASALASRIDALEAKHVPRMWYGQGHYYYLRGRSPFSRLIYPLHNSAGLGVHLGLDMAGRGRFGPDVRWIPEPDYRFDDSQRSGFAASIREWWPQLRDEDLLPDFVGVRPKLVGPGEPSGDFVVQTQATHGLPGLVNLFGIESPGLTSSLALGEIVAAELLARG